MLIQKRLLVWPIELFLGAVLLGLYFYFLSGAITDHAFLRDILFLVSGIALVFMWGSGYVLTTAILGLLWRSEKMWLYPSIAAILFVLHVQFFVTNWDLGKKSVVEARGAIIMLGCTLLGNCVLRKWRLSDARGPTLRFGRRIHVSARGVLPRVNNGTPNKLASYRLSQAESRDKRRIDPSLPWANWHACDA